MSVKIIDRIIPPRRYTFSLHVQTAYPPADLANLRRQMTVWLNRSC